MTKDLYRKEIAELEGHIAELRKLDSINSHLQKYNWIFLHPYSMGMDIGILKRIVGEAEPEAKILDVFARQFLDLRTTVHFIEGFHNTRPFLKDYVPAIRESVVLCLQKDFRGAICVLLPVIEGTLRKCLVEYKGEHKRGEIDIAELLKAFHEMSKRYVERQKKCLQKEYGYLESSGQYFDQNQERQILKKHEEYFGLWIDQLKNYLTNNLYLNTKENTVTDNLNRHVIFHLLQDDIEFTFGNYLRLFNCINFLSWSIGVVTPGCGPLSTANEDDVFVIWTNYLKILMASEAMTETKAIIYGTPIETFRKYLHPKYKEPIGRPVGQVKLLLQMMTFEKHERHREPRAASPKKKSSFINFLFGTRKRTSASR